MESRTGTIKDITTIEDLIRKDMSDMASWDRPRTDHELASFIQTRFEALKDNSSEIE